MSAFLLRKNGYAVGLLSDAPSNKIISDDIVPKRYSVPLGSFALAKPLTKRQKWLKIKSFRF